MEKDKIGVSPFTAGVFGPGEGSDEIVNATDWCVCPTCGKKKKRKEGSTCQDVTCSDCDVVMTGGLFAGVKVEEHKELGTKFQKALGNQLEDGAVSKFRVVKGKDNVEYFVAITGSAFKDLEDEILARRALDYSIRFSSLTGMFGAIDLYHIDGTEFGDVIYQKRVDKVLLEVGTFRDNVFAQRVKAWLKNPTTEVGASVAFYFDPAEFDPEEKVYSKVIIFKRAALARHHAACPWTSLGQVKV